jgi:hypothetical protein
MEPERLKRQFQKRKRNDVARAVQMARIFPADA